MQKSDGVRDYIMGLCRLSNEATSTSKMKTIILLLTTPTAHAATFTDKVVGFLIIHSPLLPRH